VGLTNLGSESETCVGSRVRLVGVSISFEKNFYRLSFIPPLWFAVSVLQLLICSFELVVTLSLLSMFSNKNTILPNAHTKMNLLYHKCA
jgi:hypothetical protein